MTIEILSIGNELLLGHTINSNASLIAQALLSHGFSVDKVTILPDEKIGLKKGIKEALKRSSFVITTGGLGPTGDDLTRDIVAEIFHSPLVYDEKVAADLICRFGEKLPTLKEQAMVPKKATILPNVLGTAPGFILEGAATLFVLPGVPDQMEEMLPEVIAYLEKQSLEKRFASSLYLSLLSEQQVDPYLHALRKKHPEVTIGICPGCAILSVYIQGKDQNLLECLRDQVAQKFESHVFSTTSRQIEKALHQWMIDHQKTFAVAESCTGGEIAARLTKCRGSSNYFLGSVVSYSDRLKKVALGVSEKGLQTEGAISKTVVIEMVKGIKKLSGADYAIATSGIAGPDGGTKESPIGTVWLAIATPEQIFTGLIPMKRSLQKRSLIIDYTATYLFAALYRYLNFNIIPKKLQKLVLDNAKAVEIRRS